MPENRDIELTRAAGHTGDLKQWEESPEGQEFIKNAENAEPQGDAVMDTDSSGDENDEAAQNESAQAEPGQNFSETSDVHEKSEDEPVS